MKITRKIKSYVQFTPTHCKSCSFMQAISAGLQPVPQKITPDIKHNCDIALIQQTSN